MTSTGNRAGTRDTGQEVDHRRRGIGAGIATITTFAGLWFIFQSGYRGPGGKQVFTLRDDPMISLDFAHTFATGHGLVWYPGAPRVDAITNPLWTLIMAVPASLGVAKHNLPLVISLIGLMVLVGTALTAAGLVESTGTPARSVVWAAGLGVGLSYPLVFWTLRGFEVGLWVWCMLAVLAAVLTLDRGPSRAAAAAVVVAVVAGVSTRLDFLIVPVVVAIWVVARGNPTRRARMLSLVLGPALLTAVVVLALQAWYFGAALPNTFTVKVSGIPITHRLERGLINVIHSLVAWLALPLLVALDSTFRGELPRRFAVLLWGLIVMIVAYDLWVGGDVWALFPFVDRFLTPAAVLIVLVAVHALPRIARWLKGAPLRRGLTVMAAVLVQIGLLPAVADRWRPAVIHLQLGDESAFSATSMLLLGAGLALGALLMATTRGQNHHRSWVVLAVVVLVAGAWIPRAATTSVAHPYTAWDATLRYYGQDLRLATEPDARIAVFAAGAIPFYSQRPAIDLLGLVDPVVARTKPHLSDRFAPGHQKWDFSHSVDVLRPDIVAQFWRGWGAAERRRLTELGYVPMRVVPVAGTPEMDITLWARRSSDRIRWDRLRPADELPTPPSRSAGT